jgi:hypothetical protein
MISPEEFSIRLQNYVEIIEVQDLELVLCLDHNQVVKLSIELNLFDLTLELQLNLLLFLFIISLDYPDCTFA